MSLAERIARDALASFSVMRASEQAPSGDDALRRAVRSSIFEMPHVDYLSPTLPEAGSRRMDFISSSNYMCEVRICVACKSYFTWNGTLSKLDCLYLPGMRMAHTDSFQTLSGYKSASEDILAKAHLTMLPEYIVHNMPRIPERILYRLRTWDDLKQYSKVLAPRYLPLFDIYTESVHARFLPEGEKDVRPSLTTVAFEQKSLGPHIGAARFTLHEFDPLNIHAPAQEPPFIPCYLIERAIAS